MAAEFAGVAADSRTVAAWTLVSRITGFGRVAVTAAVLGPTYFANLFQTASAFPSIVHELLVGSLVSAILVPPLVRHIDARDTMATIRLANGFLGVAMLASTVLILLSVVAAPLLLGLMTAAVADVDVRQQQHQLGWPLLAMIVPQILFYGVAATGVAVQHAHRRFGLATAAPVLENVGIIAVMGASVLMFGMGLDLEQVSTPGLLLLGLGSTGAVALHAAAQWWGAYQLGILLVPRAGWRDPEVRQVIRLTLPSSGYACLSSVGFFGLLVVAGAVPGGAVAFQIGYSFFNLPGALCARPVAAAQLLRLSRSFNRHQLSAFHSTYRSSLALASFIALPATFAFVFMPETLARAVSFGEMATPTGTSLVAAAIGGLGVGIVGEAAFIISTSASYARRDAVSPFQAMAIRVAITAGGVPVALTAVDGTAILWALCLSLSAANLVCAMYLYWRQVRVLPAAPDSRGGQLLGDVIASAISIIPGVLVAGWLEGTVGSGHGHVGVALAAMATSGIFYLSLQWIRGSRELRSLVLGSRGSESGAGSREITRAGTSAEHIDAAMEPPC
jgi:putative peptidoglycan lipid II flippase